jgi:hypothetical protein
MVKIQSNLNNFSFLNELKRLILSFEKTCGFPFFLDKNGILRPEIKNCPKCNSIVINNGYNQTTNKKAKKFGILPKKGKICCTKCDYALTIPKTILDNWLSKYDDWILANALSLRSKGLSISKITEHIFEMSILKVSSEYIRLKVQSAVNSIEKPQPKSESSGVIIHDEQFVKIKGVEMKRITQLDANNPNVYADILCINRLKETIEPICEKTKKMAKNIYAVVMDGFTGAHSAFIFVFGVHILMQFCLFHYAKNVKDAYKESVGYGKGRNILPLQHLIGFFNILNIFFDHEREIYYFRKLQVEMNAHIQRINKQFISFEKKQEWIEDLMKQYDKKALKYLREVKKARRRVKGIKLKLRTEEQAKILFEKAMLENEFPKNVKKQIKRLRKYWVNFTHCMRDCKIPPTSNKVEQLYSLTLNWIDKRNLQSEQEFYTRQKFSLLKRYGLNFIKEGTFSRFCETTFAMLLLFGIT